MFAGEEGTVPCAANGRSVVQSRMCRFSCLKGRSLCTCLCFTMPRTFLGGYPKLNTMSSVEAYWGFNKVRDFFFFSFKNHSF